jgi:hypothetical protein
MSDYVFWNAYNTYNAEEYLGAQRIDVLPSTLANEEYRISISLSYLHLKKPN